MRVMVKTHNGLKRILCCRDVTGADKTRVGPMLAPWTLLSGIRIQNCPQAIWWKIAEGSKCVWDVISSFDYLVCLNRVLCVHLRHWNIDDIMDIYSILLYIYIYIPCVQIIPYIMDLGSYSVFGKLHIVMIIILQSYLMEFDIENACHIFCPVCV